MIFLDILKYLEFGLKKLHKGFMEKKVKTLLESVNGNMHNYVYEPYSWIRLLYSYVDALQINLYIQSNSK